VIVGLVSYLVKNKLFICESEAKHDQYTWSLTADSHPAAESILAVALGIIIGPVALNWVSPLEWNDGDQEATNYLT
jgi:hypothetical protein